MTRAEALGIMGEPTEEYTPENMPSGFEPQMIWDAYEFHFTAFFDSSDRVSQLDVNDLDLSPQQKSEIECPFTRSGTVSPGSSP